MRHKVLIGKNSFADTIKTGIIAIESLAGSGKFQSQYFLKTLTSKKNLSQSTWYLLTVQTQPSFALA